MASGNTGARVLGVGMCPFETPRRARTYDAMAEEAIRAALADAGVELGDVQQIFAGYVYGDSTSGQNAVYRVGLPGVPVVNVNNNCSTGSSALWAARQAVEYGAAECVLAVGFEQMRPGALVAHWDDRPTPFQRFDDTALQIGGIPEDVPMAARFFGGAGMAYAERYGTEPETFASITVKARAHAAHNPNAVFRDPLTVREVLDSPTVFGTLTRLQCCPPTCGAAAAIICSPEFADRHGLNAPVEIAAQSMTTDQPISFDPPDPINLVGYDMTARAAAEVYAASGVEPTDIPVVELHDCFTPNELISYEALGLTPTGTAEKFVRDGDNTFGGQTVVNPSGGLLAKGHPLGATGLAQCAELVWQLRGQAGARQVERANLALQHNIGLGGACVVTLYRTVR
ncbi:lipid-transfer protein [Nocardia donostiensis]|uniref:propanoyl-CoA C-acyltransferase n=1 Tax=Nocardia donostiensis TaxID=1538463 RepID=A0A1V2TD24_9NOCA|nr:lipid-transfer protein [Nocardia donostiensis]ONM47406.1 lipid-transfer protein [Nocardia donostiensis]OQS14369.1 lipid-transfer protein [Nocardia donostiensis]OQS24127.1 lipid-transfer protein [Nocardia donostiensis]